MMQMMKKMLQQKTLQVSRKARQAASHPENVVLLQKQRAKRMKRKGNDVTVAVAVTVVVVITIAIAVTTIATVIMTAVNTAVITIATIVAIMTVTTIATTVATTVAVAATNDRVAVVQVTAVPDWEVTVVVGDVVLFMWLITVL